MTKWGARMTIAAGAAMTKGGGGNDDWGAGMTIWDAVFIVMASWEACSATRFLRGTAWRSLSLCQVRIRKVVLYEARGSGGQAPALHFSAGRFHRVTIALMNPLRYQRSSPATTRNSLTVTEPLFFAPHP